MENTISDESVAVNAKVRSIALYDNLDGTSNVIVPVTHAKNGGTSNPRIYKAVGVAVETSFYGNVDGSKSGKISGVKVRSSNPVDVDFHYEEYEDGSWVDLGLAYSGTTDPYLKFKGSPAEGEPSSQDRNWVPINTPFDATPFRIRLVPTGTTTLYVQVLEE